MQRSGTDPVTSPSLLLRIRNPDDQDSWSRFDGIYSPVIRSYCRRRGIQAADIDDIAQEVMAVVAKAIQNFEYEPAKGKFRGWLATVTANKLRNFANKSTIRQERFVEFVEQLADSPESDPHWTELFMQQVFNAACDQVRQEVEANTWLCFERTWVDGLSAAEVAQELALPIHTVYVNKSRVLKRMENEFVILSGDHPLADS